ncbi:MAG: replication-relaxation family protein [Candidatus Binatia bacterium]
MARRRIRIGRTAVRQTGSSARLTERDRWLRQALVKMRFLTTSHVAKLLFGGSRCAANKRLRRLLDAGLVRVWIRSLSEDNVYSLTRSAANVIGEQEGGVSTGARVPRGLDPNIDHLLAINTVRIAIAVHLSAGDGELTWWRSDWELRVPKRARLVPDALFAVTWNDQSHTTYALELDRHTKTPQRFLKKVLSYSSARFQSSGLDHDPRSPVLVVGKDPRWVERYRAGVAHVGLPLSIWFALLSEVSENPLGPIWSSATGNEKHSLREIGTLPYGKEWSVGKTSDTSQDYAMPPTRLLHSEGTQ